MKTVKKKLLSQFLLEVVLKVTVCGSYMFLLSFDLAAAILLLLQNLLERQILKNKSVPSQSFGILFFMQSSSCFLFVLLLLIPKQKFHGVLWNTELNRTECELGINT